MEPDITRKLYLLPHLRDGSETRTQIRQNKCKLRMEGGGKKEGKKWQKFQNLTYGDPVVQ